MLDLKSLKPKKGSKHKVKRVGRGTSSGFGKTCGRGHKGQKSRSGGTKGVHFEGGQNPIYRRLPKRGFSNAPFKTKYEIVNLSQLAEFDGEVNKKTLTAAGLIGGKALLKILGSGELKKALSVSADKFSASAKKKIEAAGGKIVK